MSVRICIIPLTRLLADVGDVDANNKEEGCSVARFVAAALA